MSYANVFGITRDGEDVRNAVQTFLKRWLMTYVAHVEELKGDPLGTHKSPRTWAVRNRFENFPEERLPIVLVIDTGTTGGPPKMDGGGLVRATFGIGIAVVAGGKDHDNAKHNAQVYATAIRNALEQRSSCETNWITGIDWQGEEPDPLPAEGGRALAVVRQGYRVEARGLLNARAGLGQSAPNPPPDPTIPPEDWPLLTNGSVELDKEDIVS